MLLKPQRQQVTSRTTTRSLTPWCSSTLLRPVSWLIRQFVAFTFCSSLLVHRATLRKLGCAIYCNCPFVRAWPYWCPSHSCDRKIVIHCGQLQPHVQGDILNCAGKCQSAWYYHVIPLKHTYFVCFFVGVVFTSLPTPPEDPSLAENYVNELEIFTGKQL